MLICIKSVETDSRVLSEMRTEVDSIAGELAKERSLMDEEEKVSMYADR